MDKNIICGLDLGTDKMVACIAELNSDGQIDIIGVGKSSSIGIKKGVVVDIDVTVNAIRNTIQEAITMAGTEIDLVYLGITGMHIRSTNGRSKAKINSENNEVRLEDIRRAIDATKPFDLPIDQKIIHMIPKRYAIDNQEDIVNPLGMIGNYLIAEVHIVTCGISPARNLAQCVEKAGYKVKKLVLNPWASALGVLNEEEINLGVVLIDIGAGTTDMIIFQNGAITHTSVITIAGNNITNDIALGMKTLRNFAEELKFKYGFALKSMIEQDKEIPVPGISGRPPISARLFDLTHIIECRVTELLELVKHEVQKASYNNVAPICAVISGGTALLKGMDAIAEDILEIPVRIGYPKDIIGLTELVSEPHFATSIGLLKFADNYINDPLNRETKSNGKGKGIVRNIPKFFKNIFKE